MAFVYRVQAKGSSCTNSQALSMRAMCLLLVRGTGTGIYPCTTSRQKENREKSSDEQVPPFNRFTTLPFSLLDLINLFGAENLFSNQLPATVPPLFFYIRSSTRDEKGKLELAREKRNFSFDSNFFETTVFTTHLFAEF